VKTRASLIIPGALLVAAALVVPAAASAQGLGIGPRMSFVRGDVPTNTPDTKFFGGTLRLRSSPHVVVELAMDYKVRNGLEFPDRRERIREVPMQGSILLLLSRSRLRPYLLGGFGIYTEFTDTLDVKGTTIETTRDRRTGIHLGMGAEVFVSRHAALFADYRYRFVKFGGEPEAGGEPLDIPGLSKLDLSHRGTMWTSGVAFYF
jgi:hypothetical protein